MNCQIVIECLLTMLKLVNRKMLLLLSQINDFNNMISESSNEMALSELIEKPPESWKDYNSFMNHQNNQMLPQEYIVHYD